MGICLIAGNDVHIVEHGIGDVCVQIKGCGNHHIRTYQLAQPCDKLTAGIFFRCHAGSAVQRCADRIHRADFFQGLADTVTQKGHNTVFYRATQRAVQGHRGDHLATVFFNGVDHAVESAGQIFAKVVSFLTVGIPQSGKMLQLHGQGVKCICFLVKFTDKNFFHCGCLP